MNDDNSFTDALSFVFAAIMLCLIFLGMYYIFCWMASFVYDVAYGTYLLLDKLIDKI